MGQFFNACIAIRHHFQPGSSNSTSLFAIHTSIFHQMTKRYYDAHASEYLQSSTDQLYM